MQHKSQWILILSIALGVALLGLFVFGAERLQVTTLAQTYSTGGAQAPLPPGVDARVDANTGVQAFFRINSGFTHNEVEFWGACAGTDCRQLARINGDTLAGDLPSPENAQAVIDAREPIRVARANAGYTLRYFLLATENDGTRFFVQVNVYNQGGVLEDDNTVLVIENGDITSIRQS